jgi:hypothetical protein
MAFQYNIIYSIQYDNIKLILLVNKTRQNGGGNWPKTGCSWRKWMCLAENGWWLVKMGDRWVEFGKKKGWQVAKTDGGW